ncbi:MAG: hypothetical protein JSW25_04230 [Thermoplasmata archaeon]|nr:MAG: hypothetical protein JSW25_04230 [Thermoplasmata archaeon]
MDDPNSVERYIRFMVPLACFTGTLAVLVGYDKGMSWLLMLGIFMVGFPLLVAIGYYVIQAGTDEKWVITESSSPKPGQKPYLSFVDEPLDGPGNCPTCGGALFYGRVNCPHCSESIFNVDDEARSPGR